MSQKGSKSDNKLLQDITVMMTDPQQATNEQKISKIMERIRNLKPDKAPDQLRLASCHFMTMYHTRKAMSIGMPQDGSQQSMNPYQQQIGQDKINLEAVELFKEAQRRDMELGWKLLCIRNSNSHAARTARVLKIEVAQRLEDSRKLKQAFDDLIKRTLTEEETMVAFTAAPFLGDWKQMKKLGQKIEKMPGGLDQLHMMSLQLPIPDFTLVYKLVKEHELYKRKKANIDSLKWQLFNVSKIRVKFKDVNCGEFEEKRQELIEEIQKQGDVDWEDVPNCSHVHIKRMGALCQAVSFGEIPMMLNGPWFDDKIHVQGRAEMPLMPENQQQQMVGNMNPYGMPPNANDMTILVQEEEWNLKRDNKNPKLYFGKYTLKQRPELPPKQKKTSQHAPVNMTFDCEIYIKDIIDSDNKNKYKNKYKNKLKIKNKNNSDIKNDDDDNDDNNNDNDNDNDNNTNNNNNNIKDFNEEEEINDIESTLNEIEDESLLTEFDGLTLD